MVAMAQVTFTSQLRILPESNMLPPDAEKVFADLYRSYAGDVFRFCLYLSGNWAQAQDLTSETFVRAWSSNSPVRVGTAKAYLLAIARNLYLDSLRSRKLQERLHAGLPTSEKHLAEQHFAEHREELGLALEDLNQVAEGDRSAFVMAVLEEMNHEEVARALQISVGAVKARIFRTRAKLAELRDKRNMPKNPARRG
jgi:RNA polymerase sigma-70 factor (ECF subfamily)